MVSSLRVVHVCAHCGREQSELGNPAKIPSLYYAPLGWLQSHWAHPTRQSHSLPICPVCMIILMPTHKAQLTIAEANRNKWRELVATGPFEKAKEEMSAWEKQQPQVESPNGWVIHRRMLHRFDGPLSGISYGAPLYFQHSLFTLDQERLHARFHTHLPLKIAFLPDHGALLFSPESFWGIQIRKSTQSNLGLPTLIWNRPGPMKIMTRIDVPTAEGAATARVGSLSTVNLRETLEQMVEFLLEKGLGSISR